jgi:hypothetical protein
VIRLFRAIFSPRLSFTYDYVSRSHVCLCVSRDREFECVYSSVCIQVCAFECMHLSVYIRVYIRVYIPNAHFKVYIRVCAFDCMYLSVCI